MPRDVTMAELVKMLEEGDQLSNDSPVTINGLDEIIAQLKVVAAINSELLKKTTELSELIVDKIALLQQSNTAEMRNIINTVTASQAQPKPDYTFHVERDGNGQMSSIRAVKNVH
jgi:hypothetical protein